MHSKKLLFIVGMPRSGTTWLQIMLSSHPEIRTNRELHLYGTLVSRMLTAWRIDSERPSDNGLKSVMDFEDYRKLIKIVTDRIYAKSLKDVPDDTFTYFLDKTPNNIEHFDTIKSLYPKAKFLHIYRDPRAISASMKFGEKEKWGTWIQNARPKLSKRWSATMKMADVMLSDLSINGTELSYESLSADTPKALLKIFDWLNLESDLTMCTKIAEDTTISNLAKLRTDVDHKDPRYEQRANFFRKGKIDSWKTELSLPEIRLAEKGCMTLMRKRGYVTPYDSTTTEAP